MKHTPYVCPPDCDEPYCNFCRGGLMSCTVCGGAEASAPVECPGRRMTEAEEQLVLLQFIDHRDGKWQRGKAVESSVGLHHIFHEAWGKASEAPYYGKELWIAMQQRLSEVAGYNV